MQKHHSILLQRAWNKYGAEAFEWNLIEECPIELLIIREQIWISLRQAYNPKRGFNICPRAGSFLGYKHTPESRQKMSQWQIGKVLSPEHRHKIQQSSVGKLKPGTSQALLGHKKSEAHAEKLRQHLQQDTVKQAAKQGTQTPEFRQRAKELSQARWDSLTPEARAQRLEQLRQNRLGCRNRNT